MQYIIVKYKNNYRLLDRCAIEMNVSLRGENEHITITKDNKVYSESSYEVVDDWYADTGYITHFEKDKTYIGVLVFGSDNIEEVALKFAELKGEKND